MSGLEDMAVLTLEASLNQCTIRVLDEMLKARNLPVGGLKSAKIRRLVEFAHTGIRLK